MTTAQTAHRIALKLIAQREREIAYRRRSAAEKVILLVSIGVGAFIAVNYFQQLALACVAAGLVLTLGSGGRA